MTAFDGVPRVKMFPGSLHVVPPMPPSVRRRLAFRRWVDRTLVRLLRIDVAFLLTCHCDGEHPHGDWPR